MTEKGWHTRLHEAATFPVSVPWDVVWPMLARAQAEPERAVEVRHWLWRHRHASWLASLSTDVATCRYCGDRKEPGSRSDRMFCSDSCRVMAHQSANKGTIWPLQRMAAWADREREVLLALADESAEWLSDHGPVGIVPPDLASYDNLPPPPDRCAEGCGGPCRWTRGGPCLYAGTAQET